jgi:hypothetical protein
MDNVQWKLPQLSIFKNSEWWELILKIGIMGTYINFDNSELWEHIQSELWHLSFGIMESFRSINLYMLCSRIQGCQKDLLNRNLLTSKEQIRQKYQSKYISLKLRLWAIDNTSSGLSAVKCGESVCTIGICYVVTKIIYHQNSIPIR